MAPLSLGSVGGNFLWREKHRSNNKGEQKGKPKKTDKQTGTTVGRTDFCAMDFSLRKLAYNFNTRLKRLETLRRRWKNFPTLFRTSDLEFVVDRT